MIPGTRRGAWIAALLGLLSLLLSGCAGGVAAPSPGSVSVDTPALRALKHQAGIPDCPATQAGKPVAGGFPAITLACLGGGRPVHTAGLRGPMVVNLFAQWCPPCRIELPYYAAFARRFAGKVSVLGVDWRDTNPGGALELARQAKVGYPLVADPQPQLRTANVLPRIMLVGRSGRVVWSAYREIGSVRELERLVAAHLGVAS